MRAGAPFARLTADVTDGSRQLELAVQMAEGKKKHLLNGKPKRTADLKGLVPSVTFTPDDLELAKGAMSVRRAALDALARSCRPTTTSSGAITRRCCATRTAC